MTIAAEVFEMPNLPISPRNSAAAPKGSAARRGVWLVFGWLAFWLGAVTYPCQAHHAPPITLDGPAAMEASSSTRANPNRLDSFPAHRDGACQELTAPVIGVPVAIAATAGTLNPDPPAPAAGDMMRLAPAIAVFSTHPASHPPPHTPLYLRHQRLLI
ncbi:MAG: hypothetical protein A3G25_08415 [Betaproteobacteria bacterium RIFCSPLOWO2_12_FULL_63_13]|nr:MAG: hypothetical protein A3G25_08415 [Betaproteobacteria bacterium RIFCSPLOWO2_12_FULL_63_13]